MAQHDYDIANDTGASVRADINNVLEAIASQNAGSSAPSVTFPHMPWFDESTNLLKQRNAGNTAWITVAAKDASGWRVYWNGTQLDGAAMSWTARHDFGHEFRLSGVITPSQLTSDVNDWNPTGLAGASHIRVTTDGTRTITGIAGGAEGRILILTAAQNSFILADDDAGSTAANRIRLPGSADATLTIDMSIALRYDGFNSRWRPLNSWAKA